MTDSAFSRTGGVLHAEGVSTVSLAEQFGTPLYVYSRAALTEAYRAYADASSGQPSCHGICRTYQIQPAMLSRATLASGMPVTD